MINGDPIQGSPQNEQGLSPSPNFTFFQSRRVMITKPSAADCPALLFVHAIEVIRVSWFHCTLIRRRCLLVRKFWNQTKKPSKLDTRPHVPCEGDAREMASSGELQNGLRPASNKTATGRTYKLRTRRLDANSRRATDLWNHSMQRHGLAGLQGRAMEAAPVPGRAPTT